MNNFICYCPNLYCKCKSGCNCLRELNENIQLDNQWCLCCEMQKLNYQQKKQSGNDVKKLELKKEGNDVCGKLILNSGKILKSNTVTIEGSTSKYVENLTLNGNNINIVYNDGTNTTTNVNLKDCLNKNITLQYADNELKLNNSIGITIPVITDIDYNNGQIVLSRSGSEPLNLNLNTIKDIEYDDGVLKWTYLDNNERSVIVNSCDGCECNIKNITFNNGMMIVNKNGGDLNIDFKTVLTNNDITNIELTGNNLNFTYGNDIKKTITLPNSITNITGSDNVLTLNKVDGTKNINIINSINFSVEDKKLKLIINDKPTTIELAELNLTPEGDRIQCYMNEIIHDYSNYTYIIGCCNSTKTLKIFDDYHDIITEYENGKYKSIIFSNYYTLDGETLKLDSDSTLNNLNYSLMLGGTKIITAEVIPQKIFTNIEFDINIDTLRSNFNYSKLKKIWYKGDITNIESLPDVTLIKFEQTLTNQ